MAKREIRRNTTKLVVTVQFEPSRIADNALRQAYACLVPVVYRLAKANLPMADSNKTTFSSRRKA